jgi:hypothetical protein
MRIIIRALMVFFVLSYGATAMVVAQDAVSEPEKKTIVIDKRKLLVQPRNADGTII